MKTTLPLFILLTFMLPLQAATLTDPVVDFGTITYTSATPSAWTFTVTGGNSYTMSSSGSGATWSGGSYSPLNATNLKNYGQAKYAHVRVDSQSPDSHTDSCGTIAITNIYVKPPYGGVYSSFAKKGGNPSLISGYQDGNIYFSFVGTVTPSANNTGTCTITKTYANFVHFAEGSSSEPTSGYQDVNMTFSVTIVMPETATFSHDLNAKLDFGTLCTSSQQQTLIVSPSGQATGPVCGNSANISADSFTFHSSSVNSVSVTLPSSATLSNGSGGQLTVNNFTSSCVGSCALTNNELTITVGGTLTVPDGTATGEYEGSYQVSVTY